MTSQPYTFLGLDPKHHTFEYAHTIVLPVPYDATASFKAGARDGPEAIIAASRELEDFDIELEYEPSSLGIHTSNALIPYLGGPQEMAQQIQSAVRPIATNGKLVAMLGGDHSISIGAATELARTYPKLSVLYLDAHADFRDEYMGTRWGHASSARRISEICPITIAGVRSMAQEETHDLNHSKIVVHPAPLTEGSWDAIVENLTECVYVSLDLDVLDPSLMAAVGTPEPGGLNWYEILGLLRYVAERRQIIGFDVVELTPREGPSSCSYIAAKLVYKLIGYAQLGNEKH